MSGELDAGPFGPWLARTVPVLREGAEADVPCGGCTACCESSQFVLVEPDEHDAREHIPAELLFPAPGAPKGFSLLPYDEHGRCPMLRADGCSIYDHRPRTCRTYDCRVFAAADVPVESNKPAIAARVARWRFSFDGDHDAREAVRAAARFLEAHGDELPGGEAAPPTQRAAMAVEVHHLFIGARQPTVAEVVAAAHVDRSPCDGP